MPPPTVKDDLSLALFLSEGTHSRQAVERLLSQEPFYLYDVALVRGALDQLRDEGMLDETESGLACKIPFQTIQPLLPTEDSVRALLAALSNDELVILEAVLCQRGRATKDDVRQYGFGNDTDPWRAADASRALGKLRFLIEALDEKGSVVFRVPPVIVRPLSAAYAELRDCRILPQRHESALATLKAYGYLADPRLEDAFRKIKHEAFLPEHLRHLAPLADRFKPKLVQNRVFPASAKG